MSGSIGHLLARACQPWRTSWPVGARGFEELVTMDRSAKNISPRADGDLAIVGDPSGTTGGGLAGTSPVDLLVSTRPELAARTGMDPGRVEDVIIERVAS